MKFISLSVIFVVLGINFLISVPALADTNMSVANNFEIGQKVIWLYKNRPDAADVQKIPAEVVKLSPKKVQIKVRKNNEFINRWVSPQKLEVFPRIQDSPSL
ncbi:hypothetical protein CLI64_03505 [Nostoc sp. CENA543]|uniref:hypothetical protein n=1 Tax=Nostoc sp. CENA543 TaxID=1869241 RepID=UPI000CA2BF84|nr:hypothetical protein [Nostoc sp. CENA543]AUS99525.1 hypothetical protein CLI64_03505 [Nostoc sp. CENA543]